MQMYLMNTFVACFTLSHIASQQISKLTYVLYDIVNTNSQTLDLASSKSYYFCSSRNDHQMASVNYILFELNRGNHLTFLMICDHKKGRCSTLCCGRQLVIYSNCSSLHRYISNTQKCMRCITEMRLNS